MSDYTDLIADAREWPRDGVNEGPLINALADAIEALVKERDEQGSCWDEGMTLPVREGECAPMPPKCELPHGHGGAHRAGRHEWMRRDSYNSVVAERDELRECLAAAEEGLREAHHALSAAPADALREHDAALIESLADRYRSGQLTGAFTGRDGYTQAWLRERARQVREGEA